ncbi:YcdB/YcdC domain-containing protein [Desulfitobacterium sp. Sab5]|uniref:YcdB/YcdC domain-containing protein n=1 Tax=Desulfitobacterium nosdiversum TaxID=3375356 RepID=UPI003CF0E4F5
MSCLLFVQFAVFPGFALASDPSVSTSAALPTKTNITSDQALQIAKSSFAIPEKYTQLNTNFYDYNNRPAYSLNWNSPEFPGGSFHVEVDANSGEILSMNSWDQPGKPSFKIPIITAAEAEKEALNLVTKLAGKYLPELKLVKDEGQVITLNNYQPFMYNFRWVRVINGIPFPENGVSVGVSGDKGQVASYSFNWTKDLVFPSAGNVISQETAEKAFVDTPMLELQYYLTPVIKSNDPNPQRVLPVYYLSNKSAGGAIDAVSGKPIILDPSVGIYKGMGYAPEAVKSITQPNQSTPASDVKSDAPKIGRDEAAEIVKKFVDIPKDLNLSNSSLNPDWLNPNTKVWQLDWSVQSFAPGDNRHLNARVNANTGELIGLNMQGIANTQNPSEPMSREEAQKIAEEFLNKVNAQHFAETKLQPSLAYQVKMPGNLQPFEYVRQVNGIPVSNNAMHIAIDTVGKSVIQYNMNWSNFEFPSLENVITPSKATELFLKERSLTLGYTLLYRQTAQQEVRLVYQPQLSYAPSTAQMIDAITGEPLDWSGKPKSQWIKALYFNDIQGNFAEKEINLMGLTGAFGEYGDKFNPDETATVLEFLRAMALAEGNGRDRALSDDEVLKLAKERGWTKGDTSIPREMNREYLSKIVVRLIGMETAAQAKGIYAVPFADANLIPADSLGYVALTWGLGILKTDQSTFEPQKAVTRAEAAYALVHAYAVANQ